MAGVPSVTPDAGSAPTFTLGYRPSLDGLRAIAVLVVMLFHSYLLTIPADGNPLPGGYLGVDMFFALSGFLITVLLAQEWLRRGRIDLPAFYARRGLRLLPALVVFLVAVVVADHFDAFAGYFGNVRLQSLWTMLYVENWHEVFSPSLSPLTHTWSLAVEEQFYLVWPLLLWALLAWRRSARTTITIVLVAALGSAVAMALVGAGSGRTNHFHALYGTDVRAHGLLVGAALGLAAVFGIFPRPGRRWPSFVGVLGAAYLVAAFALANGGSTFDTRGGYALAGIAATSVIFWAVYAPTTLLARGLSSRVLVAIGRVSYGAYLWHLPVYFVLTQDRTGLSFWPLLVVRFGATFAIVATSFRLVERPALRWKRRFERRVDEGQPGAPVVLAPGVTG